MKKKEEKKLKRIRRLHPRPDLMTKRRNKRKERKKKSNPPLCPERGKGKGGEKKRRKELHNT